MLGFALGRMLFGALLKPLLALICVPILMNGLGGCTGAKAELRRSKAAHKQTLERISTLAVESARLKTLADQQRARADANKEWALQEERKPCPDTCLLPD